MKRVSIKRVREKLDTEPPRRELPVKRALPSVGLSEAEATARTVAGWSNTSVDPPGKTAGEIVRDNLLTFYNLLFLFFAVCVLIVSSWQNAMFMGVVIANTAIGIFQELRAKRTLDKLTLITAPKATVIRDGKRIQLPIEQAVRDDIVVFSQGAQIFADAEVVEGECSANEALITGEADEIKKSPGSELLSGSFVVAGECLARLTQVGRDSYASQLTIKAREQKAPPESEMMRSLDRLVKVIGFMVIPLGVLMALKEIVWLDRGIADGVVATVASLIGMIPEGLYLLTSMALMAGVVRLAQKKTLVHDMGCIETLARVDVLCVDKTGTVTENKMTVDDISLLCPERYVEDDIRLIMADYVAAMKADNDTMAALRNYFGAESKQTALSALPFSSAKKFGGVSFHEDETYLLGAPDILLGADFDKYRDIIDGYSAKGCRVLLLALYDGSLEDERISAPLMPLSLILLSNKVRAEAPETFRYFEEQGVAIKVISGDNAMAVSEVAKRAGIKNAEKYIDARELETDEQVAAAISEHTVFGRVTPEQKRRIILALKAEGHTVAMTGDGVNDVLALKEADCSIAMASGSDAASYVSHIVLLDSNFAAMPHIVAEGRRVINNIQRSATLFLVKNIFSFTIAVLSLLFALPFPVTSAQMSLVNVLTIGIPGFILAMEPNKNLVSGHFLRNVAYNALPGALTDIILILGVTLFCRVFDLHEDMASTICTVTLGIVGLLIVHRLCRPYNLLRRVLMGGLTIFFAVACFHLKELFTLYSLDLPGIMILVVFALLAWPLLQGLTKTEQQVGDFINKRRAARAKIKERLRSRKKQ